MKKAYRSVRFLLIALLVPLLGGPAWGMTPSADQGKIEIAKKRNGGGNRGGRGGLAPDQVEVILAGKKGGCQGRRRSCLHEDPQQLEISKTTLGPRGRGGPPPRSS